ncbi:MAG: tail-specific protease [Gammaproteobacteria bacterium]|nr:tail-specific protease [Gammaproteobacteria bacterium]
MLICRIIQRMYHLKKAHRFLPICITAMRTNLVQSILAITCCLPLLALSDSLGDLEQTPIPKSKLLQSSLTKAINYQIDKDHYLELPLDDELSGHVFERYLDQLDPGRFFFTQNDIDQFSVARHKLDDHIKSGIMDASFLIFSIYRQRVDERIQFALDRLRQPFDFDKDETYLLDRENAPWAKDREMLNELWRKRIKNDLLISRLSKARNPEKESRDVFKILEQRYTHIARRVRQLKSEDVFQTFINAYARSIEPHSAYFTPRVAENFKIEMRLSLEGIGAVLQTDNEYTLINRIILGGPADIDGRLLADDRIIGVAQSDSELVDVIGWRLDDVVDLIRGAKGTEVKLEILPGEQGLYGEPETISLIRNQIKLEEKAARKKIINVASGDNELKIGIIDLPAFYHDFEGKRNDPDFRSTTRDVRKLLDEFREDGIDGLIVDLRGNGGGALPEAIALAGLFIPKGPIVQTRYTHGYTRVGYDPDPKVAYGGPLAVLVDRYSASASEIFAGAIKDYGRGLVIGETTFGKGTVQSLITLGNKVDLGQLKITTAQFFRVNGESTQHKGVIPDIIWYTSELDANVGERSFENSIPWRKIKKAKYSPFQPVKAVNTLEYVKESHQRRISDHPEFNYIQKISTLNKQRREEKLLTLNEEKRKADREWLNQQTLQLENERRDALGKETFETIEALDKFYSSSDKDDDNDDPFLIEGAKILADYYLTAKDPIAESNLANQAQNSNIELLTN